MKQIRKSKGLSLFHSKDSLRDVIDGYARRAVSLAILTFCYCMWFPSVDIHPFHRKNRQVAKNRAKLKILGRDCECSYDDCENINISEEAQTSPYLAAHAADRNTHANSVRFDFEEPAYPPPYALTDVTTDVHEFNKTHGNYTFVHPDSVARFRDSTSIPIFIVRETVNRPSETKVKNVKLLNDDFLSHNDMISKLNLFYSRQFVEKYRATQLETRHSYSDVFLLCNLLYLKRTLNVLSPPLLLGHWQSLVRGQPMLDKIYHMLFRPRTGILTYRAMPKPMVVFYEMNAVDEYLIRNPIKPIIDLSKKLDPKDVTKTLGNIPHNSECVKNGLLYFLYMKNTPYGTPHTEIDSIIEKKASLNKPVLAKHTGDQTGTKNLKVKENTNLKSKPKHTILEQVRACEEKRPTPTPAKLVKQPKEHKPSIETEEFEETTFQTTKFSTETECTQHKNLKNRTRTSPNEARIQIIERHLRDYEQFRVDFQLSSDDLMTQNLPIISFEKYLLYLQDESKNIPYQSHEKKSYVNAEEREIDVKEVSNFVGAKNDIDKQVKYNSITSLTGKQLKERNFPLIGSKNSTDMLKDLASSNLVSSTINLYQEDSRIPLMRGTYKQDIEQTLVPSTDTRRKPSNVTSMDSIDRIERHYDANDPTLNNNSADFFKLAHDIEKSRKERESHQLIVEAHLERCRRDPEADNSSKVKIHNLRDKLYLPKKGLDKNDNIRIYPNPLSSHYTNQPVANNRHVKRIDFKNKFRCRKNSCEEMKKCINYFNTDDQCDLNHNKLKKTVDNVKLNQRDLNIHMDQEIVHPPLGETTRLLKDLRQQNKMQKLKSELSYIRNLSQNTSHRLNNCIIKSRREPKSDK